MLLLMYMYGSGVLDCLQNGDIIERLVSSSQNLNLVIGTT